MIRFYYLFALFTILEYLIFGESLDVPSYNPPIKIHQNIFKDKLSTTDPLKGNRYDLLAKMLIPTLSAILSNQGKNLLIKGRIITVSGNLPKKLDGVEFIFQYEHPNKFIFEFPSLEEKMIMMSDGKNISISPGEKIDELWNRTTDTEKIIPFSLPSLNIKQAFLIPALFQIQDNQIIESIDNIPCRHLTASFISNFNQPVNQNNTIYEVWISSTYVPQQITIKNNFNSITLKISNYNLTSNSTISFDSYDKTTSLFRCNTKEIGKLITVLQKFFSF